MAPRRPRPLPPRPFGGGTLRRARKAATRRRATIAGAGPVSRLRRRTATWVPVGARAVAAALVPERQRVVVRTVVASLQVRVKGAAPIPLLRARP